MHTVRTTLQFVCGLTILKLAYTLYCSSPKQSCRMWPSVLIRLDDTCAKRHVICDFKDRLLLRTYSILNDLSVCNKSKQLPIALANQSYIFAIIWVEKFSVRVIHSRFVALNVHALYPHDKKRNHCITTNYCHMLYIYIYNCWKKSKLKSYARQWFDG